MWFRLKYLDGVGQELGATFSARDPKMVEDRLRELRINPLMVRKLWINVGEGYEPWKPSLLMEILRDAGRRLETMSVWIGIAIGIGAIVVFILGSGGFAILVIAICDRLLERVDTWIVQYEQRRALRGSGRQ
jgi:hypothetical protein